MARVSWNETVSAAPHAQGVGPDRCCQADVDPGLEEGEGDRDGLQPGLGNVLGGGRDRLHPGDILVTNHQLGLL